MTVLGEQKVVIEMCDKIKAMVHCEFVGLAIQNEMGPDVRWHYATGNLNDKYERITVRFGKGIAGKVISSGSALMITDFPNGLSGKVTDYPIMLAEKLISSYAVPLFFQDIPKGVLLVGNREPYTFTTNEQQQIKESAQALELLIKAYI